jgi:N-acylglucosamine 2-epimerase
MPNQSVLTAQRINELSQIYRAGLLEDVVPFWMKHAVDHEHGGYFVGLDRDGTVIDTDKGGWQHGRFIWLLATLYQTVEPRPEWLDTARSGLDFLRQHGFDDDGRMFFRMTREGKPLIKRRYIFTETFGVAALAAYAGAAGDDEARQQAIDLYDLIVRYLNTPGLLEPKVDPRNRPAKGLAIPMIMTATTQILRDVVDDKDAYTEKIDRYIAEIERDFMKPEFEAVLEMVGANGELIDHFEGRTLNPGHGIEAAWFILYEAKQRNNDARLIQLGTKILDWMWKWGWDEEYGGIIYFRDVKGHSPTEYWHDMKFWWNQCEAIIATLMAYQLTGDEKYARWHQMAHDWAYARFPDAEHGEWFGYLHRDGRLSSPVKATVYKTPFHIPRMQLMCWQMLESMKGSTGDPG